MGRASSPSIETRTGVDVVPASSGKLLDQFIRLPEHLYAGNQNWVAPLRFMEKRRLSAKHNAFYQHADVELFVALRDGQPVGRISAQVDHEHNRHHRDQTGFFGFFECIDDIEVARALLETAEGWLRDRGMNAARGPLNFSMNGEVGMLIEGFEYPPQPLMPYSQPYYARLLEELGYGKAKDLYAWKWEPHQVPHESARRAIDKLRSRPDVVVRRARMNNFRAEVGLILDMYNDAWKDNWGFVPATEAEADEVSSDLRLVVDPRIVPFVEINGVPAGAAVAVPDSNWAMQPLKGSLFPIGWARFLWRLKVRRPKSGRMLILGIRKEYRTREYAGLAYLLAEEVYLGAMEAGFTGAEFGWTLEDNGLVNSLIRRIGCEQYKRYRIYEKPLT